MDRLLITGAGGFIGSHLAELCVRSGYAVRALVRYNSTDARGWLDHSSLVGEMEVVRGDVRELESVMAAVEGCRGVLHLAALIGIPYSYAAPLSYLKTNIEGTYNVLEAARRCGVERLVVTSTSETYGSARYVPMDEDHPQCPQSPYAATKVAADQLALSYHLSFGVPVAIVRPFNAYGPRQSPRAIVPALLQQMLRGHHELSLGNVAPTRDLTYVTDTAAGFLAVFTGNGLLGQVTHVGVNEEISIGGLAELMASLLGMEVVVRCDPQRLRPVASEVVRLRCDNRKLLTRTQWRPTRDLREGLRATIEWFREHPSALGGSDYRV
jgi:dTDP-glucose 4,6-dehydratase